MHVKPQRASPAGSTPAFACRAVWGLRFIDPPHHHCEKRFLGWAGGWENPASKWIFRHLFLQREPTAGRGSLIFAVINPFPWHNSDAGRCSLPTKLLRTRKCGQSTLAGTRCRPSQGHRKMLAEGSRLNRKERRRQKFDIKDQNLAIKDQDKM